MAKESDIIIIIIIIIITIIMMHIPYFTAVQLVLKRVLVSRTERALLIHCSAKNFLTLWHVLSITYSCMGYIELGGD